MEELFDEEDTPPPLVYDTLDILGPEDVDKEEPGKVGDEPAVDDERTENGRTAEHAKYRW